MACSLTEFSWLMIEKEERIGIGRPAIYKREKKYIKLQAMIGKKERKMRYVEVNGHATI